LLFCKNQVSLSLAPCPMPGIRTPGIRHCNVTPAGLAGREQDHKTEDDQEPQGPEGPQGSIVCLRRDACQSDRCGVEVVKRCATPLSQRRRSRPRLPWLSCEERPRGGLRSTTPRGRPKTPCWRKGISRPKTKSGLLPWTMSVTTISPPTMPSYNN